MQTNSIKTGEGSDLATPKARPLHQPRAERRLSRKDARTIASFSEGERDTVTQVLALPDDKYRIMLALLCLMTEGEGGQPLLTTSARAHALETFLPELERLRAATDFNPESLRVLEATVAKAKGRQEAQEDLHDEG